MAMLIERFIITRKKLQKRPLLLQIIATTVIWLILIPSVVY